MHAVRHRPHPFEEALSAQSELGWHEPLAHALKRYAVALAQLSVASAVCGLTLVTVAAGVEFAVPVVLASAATGLVLAARLSPHDCCGHQTPPPVASWRPSVCCATVGRRCSDGTPSGCARICTASHTSSRIGSTARDEG
jgi:hypothetical protein